MPWLALLLMWSAPAVAGQEYFTWVDAQGRIHNSPKPAASTPAPATEKGASTADEPYLSEEEFAAEQQRQREEKPPFFTWVDGEGRLRSEPVPQGNAAAAEVAAARLSDHTLLPALRVSEALRQSGCCQAYQTHASRPLRPEKSVLFSRPQASPAFHTRQGDVPAWYIQMPLTMPEAGAEPLLSLRLRGSAEASVPALIALDEHWQPLHFIPRLQLQYYPENWHSVAMRESLVAVVDRAVRAVIVYFPAGVSEQATLEVEWRP